MKWIFSLTLILFSGDSCPRELVLITYKRDSPFREEVERILLKKLELPPKYLTWREVPFPCRKQGSPLLQICLLELEKDFKVVQGQPLTLKKTLGRIIVPLEEL